MTKWQHNAIQLRADDLGQVVKQLELQGEEGWELVNVLATEWSQDGATTFTAWFKRQKPDRFLK